MDDAPAVGLGFGVAPVWIEIYRISLPLGRHRGESLNLFAPRVMGIAPANENHRPQAPVGSDRETSALP